MFKSYQEGGFSITFENGIEVSVSFNLLAKCGQRSVMVVARGSSSGLAEICAWDKDGEVICFDGVETDSGSYGCHGYMTPEEVALVLYKAAHGELEGFMLYGTTIDNIDEIETFDQDDQFMYGYDSCFDDAP